jgi:mRNA interferase RelE/StbE
MDLRYKIEIKESALKSLVEMPARQQLRIKRKIDVLAENPCPPGHRKIKGEEHTYRIRVGDYRVVYRVFETTVVIMILRIGHRKDVYR